jgi:asparagine synthase (glutamine-hydrolysing)
MSDSSGKVWITFNGEIYNYLELRNELRSAGHSFVTGTDTEVLLCAYLEWGAACVNHLNGMWAFAIWDGRVGTMFCSVDHFAIKPFYFTEANGMFLFGSEPRALIRTGMYVPEPHDESIFRYLVHNEPPARGDSFFKGMNLLAGGAQLVVSCRSTSVDVQKSTWWKAVSRNTNIRSAVELRELFVDSVRLRLRSDVPVGACLSGGLDSSLVVACMRHVEPGAQIETFTATFPGTDIDEALWARVASDSFRTRHHEVLPTAKSFVEDMEKLISSQGEPFHGLSVYAQYTVMRAAREAGIKVLLDGQGSDELFLGYHWHLVTYVARLIRDGRLLAASGFLRDILRFRKDISLARFLALFVLFRFPMIRNTRNLMRAGGAINKDFLDQWQHKISARVVGEQSESRLSEIRETVLPRLLRYEDRNSMAFSVEARLPFLDHRLVEAALEIPEELLLKGGVSKVLLRQAAHPLLPETLWARKDKVGFAVPEREWLNGIRPYAAELLADSSRFTQPYIDAAKLQSAVAQGSSDSQWIWRALNLYLWLKKVCVTN